MVMFSELGRYRLRDARGAEARLVDLTVDLASGEYPVVTRVLFGEPASQRRELPWEAVRSIDQRAQRIVVDDDLSAPPAGSLETLEQTVLVERDMMDALIIDLPKRQTMRANDLWLEQVGGQLWLTAADIGPWAVLRRLGRGLLGKGANRNLVDWRDVEFLRGDPRAARRGNDYHRRVARLQASEIAQLLDAMPYLHSVELLTLIPDPLAADTVEVMRPERQMQVFEELEDDQRARLLALMAPHNAADLLGRLGPEGAAPALEALPAERREAIVELLRYPADTAGGIMTNEIIVVPLNLDVAQLRLAIRGELEGPDFVYYTYVVDDMQSRRLEGVLTLRDVLLADDAAPIEEVMRRSVDTLDPRMSAIDAARRVAEQHLAALPVVDEDRRLVGAVTADAALLEIAPPSLQVEVPRVFT
jgi:magnesium transporter